MAIRNPVEWGVDHWRGWSHAVGTAGRAAYRREEDAATLLPAVRRIGIADLGEALKRGIDDFMACRTDVIFLAIVYPVAGLILSQVIFGRDLLHLLFPLASGFALLGPFAAVGLYGMSRRREAGEPVSWADAFRVTGSPSFGAVMALGLVLTVVFLLWLLAAWGIHAATLGPEPPASLGSLLDAVFTTSTGWTMLVVGMGVGFLFALLVLTISVVSFPLLIDRRAGVGTAIRVSARAVALNPVPMAAWGLVVAGALIAGTLPAFVGLIVVMPVLGHATWHLYRRVLPRGPIDRPFGRD